MISLVAPAIATGNTTIVDSVAAHPARRDGLL